MQKLKKGLRQIDHIGIQRIIFDRTEWVTLWGFILVDGHKKPMDYLLNFERLNKLLRLSGEEGSRIEMLLVEKLEKKLEEPTIIDLEALFGRPAFFNQCLLEVSPTWSVDADGRRELVMSCLSIDGVYPLLGKKQQTLSSQTQYRQSLIACEEQLAASYALYLGYLELEMDEEAALRMADLQDDLKFKMAYFAWKMNQKVA